jgi:DNA-binding NarL/FixJ family response regulator
VVVVDDHEPMRVHIAAVIGREFDVVGVYADAESMLDAWMAVDPAVVVLDVLLPGLSGFDAARALRAAGCPARVVFLSVHQAPEIVRVAWEAGASGYVAKQDVGVELLSAIRAALAGRRFLSSSIPGEPAGW